MDTSNRCQSCGMPLGPGFYGTFEDGIETETYCKICFSDGTFSNPGQTMDGMISTSIKQMTEEMGIPIEDAQKMAMDMIPALKRWKKE